ncbi:tyrosine-type recombinase/integrase [Thalassobius sp. MITS945101]|uniref:tyrosine-type recombinase/integrase n=1 Tax=Thalassobius sp. MITS945101 TaxID=3096994 RepID=UPI0039996F87
MHPKTDLPPIGRATLKDPEIPGLELRGNSKSATWTLRHRVDGHRIRDTIGRWPGLSAVAARKAAYAKIASVAITKASGGDVLAQRAERQKFKKARSFDEALKIYSAQRSDLRTIDHAERVIRNVFACLLQEKLPALTKAKLLACNDKHRESAPSVADLSIRYLRPFLKWAYDRGEVSPDLLTLRVGQTAKRDRYLSKQELAAILRAVQSQGTHVAAAATKMMVASAQRRNEVAGMKWSEVEGNLWTIPGERTKTGNDYFVPLNQMALEVLKEVETKKAETDLVFAGRTGVTPFGGWSKYKAKLDEKSGVSDWTFHDIRRTFATLCADEGVDAVIIDRCLNHVGATSLNDVARRYQHSSMIEQKRLVMDQWSEILMCLTNEC